MGITMKNIIAIGLLLYSGALMAQRNTEIVETPSLIPQHLSKKII